VSSSFALILDVLVVVLLGATIFYAATLSRRLAQLRGDRGDLQSAVRTLAEAAAKAEAGVKGLRTTADETGARLQKQIDRAQALRDELGFLIDAGESLADRLETAASQAGERRRQQEGAAGEETPAAAANAGERRREAPAVGNGKAPGANGKSAAGNGKAAAGNGPGAADGAEVAKPAARSERRGDLRAEPARRSGALAKSRGGTDRSLINAIESLR
jgi:hypothetical protein